jgi:outer membrane protein TolC
VELPFQRAKRDAALREREESLQESRAGFEAVRREVEGAVQGDFHMAMSESRLARLYRDTMLPQQRLALDASLASYETGSVDFMSVLASFGAVLESEMSYLESLTEFHVAVSRIEAVTGPILQ